MLGENLIPKDAKVVAPQGENKGKIEVGTKPAEGEGEVAVSPKIERNYEGFSEDERKLLEKMSNPSYEWTAKTIKELRAKADENKTLKEKLSTLEQGKQTLPESYYQNSEGYLLSNDYRSLLKDTMDQETIISHWEKQALAIEKGEEWTDLVETKDGIFETKPIKPTYEAKAEIGRRLMRCYANLEKQREDLGVFKANFAARNGEFRNKLAKSAEEYFPSFTTKANDETKKVLTDTKEWLKKGGIPEDNPLFDLLSMASSAALLFRAQLVEALKAKEVKVSAAQDATKAGPNGSDFQGGSGQKEGKGGEAKKVTVNDMNKFLGEAV
jgi:hypothetical protein